ncbi:MAG: glycosyltransferase [Peptostreptococcaceae bacterium]|nr:glycosyltransferase [Peptostreptococcaceae bacterium]
MKILILTCKFGMGHFSASKSIQQKLIEHYDGISIGEIDLKDYYQSSPKKLVVDFWRELKNLKIKFDDFEFESPNTSSEWSNEIREIKIVDIFELAYPEYIDILYKGYGSIVDKTAKLMNFIYKRSDEVPPSESKALELIYNHILGSVTKLLLKEQPDIIISAFSICSEIISDYKEHSRSNIPLVTVITDIHAHSTWINKNTDYYLVAVEETKRTLMENSVPESQIKVVGMPVNLKFERLKRLDFPKAEKESGSKRKRLLIMGGGLGLVPADMDFYDKLSKVEGLEITVVAGQNKSLYRKLNRRFDNIHVLGFTDKVQELMLESDLLLSKSGGITTFEAIYARLPIAIFKPFLAQEISNAEFVVQNNLGILLPSKMSHAVDDIDEVLKLLFDDERLELMCENMNRVVSSIHEDGLIEIVDSLRSDLEKEYQESGVKERIKLLS